MVGDSVDESTNESIDESIDESASESIDRMGSRCARLGQRARRPRSDGL